MNCVAPPIAYWLLFLFLESGVEDERGVDFRKLHADVSEKLIALCEVWEGKEGSLAKDTPNLEDGE
jgi:hypothetical protein